MVLRCRTSTFAGLFLAALVGVAASVAAGQCTFALDKHVPDVTYRFTPEVTPYGLTLHVRLETQTEPNGSLALEVPVRWAGETQQAVTNLHALSAGATITDGGDPGTKLVHARPGRTVLLAYDLVKDWNGPLKHPRQFHPVLLPQYFEFTGSNALVQPEFPFSERGTVHFDWTQLPPAWIVATSFGAADAGQSAARCQTETGPWHDAWNGLYTAGDFRLHRFLIGGQPAVLAIRGSWTFTDDAAIARLQQVIGAVRNFWHDTAFPYFLVTVKAYDQDSGSTDGSAFTHAFWMYMSRQDSMDALLPTLSHETFHEWDPSRMGSLSSADDRALGWFKEGVTDYYGTLLLYRSGAMSEPAYFASLNNMLRKFPVSDSPYVRGRGIALWLDGEIRKQSGGKDSLDSVMYDMVRGANEPLTPARVYATISRYVPSEDLQVLHAAVDGRGELDAPASAPSTTGCWAREQIAETPYALGFDLEASKGPRTVTGVQEGSLAYLAGLRNGQPLKGWSVVSDPDRKARITIFRDGIEEQIEFYPRGTPVDVWQYVQKPHEGCTSSSTQ